VFLHLPPVFEPRGRALSSARLTTDDQLSPLERHSHEGIRNVARLKCDISVTAWTSSESIWCVLYLYNCTPGTTVCIQGTSRTSYHCTLVKYRKNYIPRSIQCYLVPKVLPSCRAAFLAFLLLQYDFIPSSSVISVHLSTSTRVQSSTPVFMQLVTVCRYSVLLGIQNCTEVFQC
jgi:hypothetical protein